MDYVFILAGGKGTRLWPASLSSKPKQFIKLTGSLSLFQLSLLRAAAVKPEKAVIVISLVSQKELVERDVREIGDRLNVPVMLLSEPAGRNTAPAISSAVHFIEHGGKHNLSVLVLTSDHLIEPVASFTEDLKKAEKLVEKGYITTFGIVPERPETGYGYIEKGEDLKYGFSVKSFREKPDALTAAKYLKSGRFFWNSGMFAFGTKDYLGELNRQAPDIAKAFAGYAFPPDEPSAGFSTILDDPAFAECYGRMPSISVDYAVMENCRKTGVVSASFSWTDLGSWDEIAVRLKDSVAESEICPAGSNFVYSDIPVSIQGIDDLIVVIKNGRCLVCPKGKSQLVRNTIEQLKKAGRDDLL